jgi:hypothetical protein
MREQKQKANGTGRDRNNAVAKKVKAIEKEAQVEGNSRIQEQKGL